MELRAVRSEYGKPRVSAPAQELVIVYGSLDIFRQGIACAADNALRTPARPVRNGSGCPAMRVQGQTFAAMSGKRYGKGAPRDLNPAMQRGARRRTSGTCRGRAAGCIDKTQHFAACAGRRWLLTIAGLGLLWLASPLPGQAEPNEPV